MHNTKQPSYVPLTSTEHPLPADMVAVIREDAEEAIEALRYESSHLGQGKKHTQGVIDRLSATLETK